MNSKGMNCSDNNNKKRLKKEYTVKFYYQTTVKADNEYTAEAKAVAKLAEAEGSDYVLNVFDVKIESEV